MGALSTARLLLQVLSQVIPPIVQEIQRRRQIGLDNDALELAVLKHKDEIEKLPIQKVIAIGGRK